MKSVPARAGCSGPIPAVALKEPVLVRRFLRKVGRWARISGLRQLATVVPKSHGALGDVLRHLGGEEELFLLDGVEGFVEVLSGRPEQAVAATEGVGGDAEVVREACDADADGAAGVLLLPYREPDGHGKPGGVPAVGATGQLLCAFTSRCRHGSILFGLTFHPLTLACRDLPSSGDKLEARDDDPIT